MDTSHNLAGPQAAPMSFTLNLSDRRDYQSQAQQPYNSQVNAAFRVSQSPAPVQTHVAGPSTMSFQAMEPPPPHASPSTMNKRKAVDTSLLPASSSNKRRRDPGDDDDLPAGAKHWTEAEKTKLFKWLMGPGQDDRFNALKVSKNSCLRECAAEVFEGKKSYQALKGCFERNFNIFKQIYAVDLHSQRQGENSGFSLNLPEGERVREFERRITSAKKAGIEVGGLNARTVEHWYRIGWYLLFYTRWSGDPAASRWTVSNSNHHPGGVEEEPEEDSIDYPDPMSQPEFAVPPPPPSAPETFKVPEMRPPDVLPDHTPAMSVPPSRSHTHAHSVPAPTPAPAPAPPAPSSAPLAPAASTSSPSTANASIDNELLRTLIQLLKMHNNNASAKLEYLRRRDEREERESKMRMEMERLKQKNDASMREQTAQVEMLKQKVEAAKEIVSNANIDASFRRDAGEFLKNFYNMR